jgi:hypothetical protein
VEIISLLKKRNRKLKTGRFSLFEKRETEKLKAERFSLFGKRETEKLTALYSFIKKSLKLFLLKKKQNSNDTLKLNSLFKKEIKLSNGTCNLYLFSLLKEKQKINDT